MDDDDIAIGGGAAAAQETQSAYNPYGKDKIPTNGIESKPMYATTVIEGNGGQGGKKGRKRNKGGNQNGGQEVAFNPTRGGFF